VESYNIIKLPKNLRLSKTRATTKFLLRIVLSLTIAILVYTKLGVFEVQIAGYVGLTAWGSMTYPVNLIIQNFNRENIKWGSYRKGVKAAYDTLAEEFRDRARGKKTGFYARAAAELESRSNYFTRMLEGNEDDRN
jgi:hypothetical protein